MTQFTCLSLFTGAGGLDVGIDANGSFRLLACVEVNPKFCESLRLNRDSGRFGDARTKIIEGDISMLDPHALMSECGIEPGELDLLIGGPPCQSFSTAGRRGTVQDPRGELLWHFLRFVVAFRPKMFLMENVRGLLSAALRHRSIAERPDKGGELLAPAEEQGSVVELWTQDLVEQTAGEYRVDCFEVNAVNYGAPQLRERVLFVGNRFGLTIDFPEPTHGSEPIQQGQRSLFGGLQSFRTLRDAIGAVTEETPELLDFSPRKKEYLAMVPPGGNWRSLPPHIQQESMGRAWFAKGGRSGWWRRLSWDLPCPTIVTMPNHASTSMCHPNEVRVLSLKECALVQEFPAEWEFAGTTSQKYIQVGNAVPIRLGVVAAELLAGILDRLRHNDDLWIERRKLPHSKPLRRVYLSSHIRTRQWFKGGETFVWNDDGDPSQNPKYGSASRKA